MDRKDKTDRQTDRQTENGKRKGSSKIMIKMDTI